MMNTEGLPIQTKFSSSFFVDSECALKISTDTKRLWAVILDLFLEFDRICKKHDIRYCLAGGSVLGAVRHGGFIPWDDDMDIAMTRDEYEKLCAVAMKEFTHPYFFQTNDTDPGSARGHAQLRNNLTTGILKGEAENGRSVYGFNQGVFLDIFPHDVIPDDPNEREAFIQEIARIKGRISSIRYFQNMWRRFGLRVPGMRTMIKTVLLHLWERFSGRNLLTDACHELDHTCKRYNGSTNKMMSDISFSPFIARKRHLYRDMFEEFTMMKYCGYDVPIPKRYDDYLTACYGDWHKHVVGASQHGGLILDLFKPYTEYLKK